MIKLKFIEVQGAWEEWEGGNPDMSLASPSADIRLGPCENLSDLELRF